MRNGAQPRNVQNIGYPQHEGTGQDHTRLLAVKRPEPEESPDKLKGPHKKEGVGVSGMDPEPRTVRLGHHGEWSACIQANVVAHQPMEVVGPDQSQGNQRYQGQKAKVAIT